MAYDPYQQESGDSQGISLNPFSYVGDYYKFKYFQNPLTYSFSKGIATPFGFSPTSESLRKFGSAVSSTFKDKGYRAAAGAIWDNWDDMSSAGGGRVYKSDKLNNRIKTTNNLKNNIKNQYNILKDEDYYMDHMKKYKMLRTGKIYKPSVYSYKMLRTGKMYTPPISEIILSESQINRRKEIVSKLSVLNKRHEKASDILGSLKGQAFRRNLVIGAGKATSIVGLGMLVADVGMMIGEPVGRAIINQTNSAMERYERRFMPETGGHLNAAYLSYGAATERQRAVNAIAKGYINGRSAFGQEASMMHS